MVINHHTVSRREIDKKSASQVALVVKNLPANAGDIRDVGSIPGSFIWACYTNKKVSVK